MVAYAIERMAAGSIEFWGSSHHRSRGLAMALRKGPSRPKQSARSRSPAIPSSEAPMFQFLIVKFGDGSDPSLDRTVLANGNPVGITNHMFLMSAGVYSISLSGSGYSPPQQTVTLANTTAHRPAVVVFT
jgi:hypothetical protein